MNRVLVIVDMQNDFIDGVLGTSEAVCLVPKVIDRIKKFEGTIIYTRDSHDNNYLDTQEGKKLPVKHCIIGTHGWQIHENIACLIRNEAIIDKPLFGSSQLGELLQKMNEQLPISDITLIGLCTDICINFNAMILKVYLPEVPIIVDGDYCAGTTPENHRKALDVMKICQIDVK